MLRFIYLVLIFIINDAHVNVTVSVIPNAVLGVRKKKKNNALCGWKGEKKTPLTSVC